MRLPEPNRNRSIRRWTQADLKMEAAKYSHQFRPGEQGHGRPSVFSWNYDPAFSLVNLGGDPDEWAEWAAQERLAWIESFGDDRGPELSEYWLPNPEEDPVVVAEGKDGLFYIWDGNHRIGVAFSAGLVAVPAIVGRRKKRRVVPL
jgi:hypothetical protein